MKDSLVAIAKTTGEYRGGDRSGGRNLGMLRTRTKANREAEGYTEFAKNLLRRVGN